MDFYNNKIHDSALVRTKKINEIRQSIEDDSTNSETPPNTVLWKAKKNFKEFGQIMSITIQNLSLSGEKMRQKLKSRES